MMMIKDDRWLILIDQWRMNAWLQLSCLLLLQCCTVHSVLAACVQCTQGAHWHNSAAVLHSVHSVHTACLAVYTMCLSCSVCDVHTGTIQLQCVHIAWPQFNIV